MLTEAEADQLVPESQLRHDDPGWLPVADADRTTDARFASLALTTALRRHARPVETADGRTPGRDLSQVRVVIASGGVFRHADPAQCAAMLAPATSDHGGGWKVPRAPRVTVDRRYVMAAAGLLSDDYRDAAVALLAAELSDVLP